MIKLEPSPTVPGSQPAPSPGSHGVGPVSAPSPVTNPFAQPAGEGWQIGGYALICEPGLPNDPTFEIRVRPLARVASSATTAKLNLTSIILVENAGSDVFITDKGSAGPAEVRNKEIKKDEGGDYASITIGLNRSFGGLEKFIEAHSRTSYSLRITVFIEMSAIMGLAGGFGLSGGAMGVPVPGTTKCRMMLLKPIKLSFAKFFWKEQKTIDAREIPDVDLDALNLLIANGGQLRVRLNGELKLSDDLVFTSEKVPGAEFYASMEGAEAPELGGNLQLKKIPGVYDEALNRYVFNIPKPPGQQCPDSPGCDIDLKVDVADELRNRLGYLYKRTTALDSTLESSLQEDAKTFLTACLDHISSETDLSLRENREAFTNATFGVSYYMEFCQQAAKGLRTSLQVHNHAYNRYQEDLINGLLEFLFFMGDEMFETFISKIITLGREVMEKLVKSEAKTLAEFATEAAENTIKTHKDEAKKVLEGITSKIRKIHSYFDEVWGRFHDHVEAYLKLDVELTEKTSKRIALETETKQLGEAFESLKKSQKEMLEESGQAATKLEQETAKLGGVSKDVKELTEDTVNLADDLGFKKAQLETAREEAQTATQKAAEDKLELAGKSAALGNNTLKTQQASQNLRECENHIKDAQDEIARLNTAEQFLADTDAPMAKIKEVRQARAAQESRLSGARQTAAAERAQLARLETEKKSLQSEIGQLEKSINQAESDASRHLDDAREFSEQAGQLESELGQKNRKLVEKRTREEELSKSVEVKKSDAERLGGEADRLTRQVATDQAVLDEKIRVRETLKKEGQEIADEMAKNQISAENCLKGVAKFLDEIEAEHPALEAAEKQLQAMEAQDGLIQSIKAKGKGMSEEEYQQLLEQAFRDCPTDEEFGRRIFEGLSLKINVERLQQLEQQLLAARSRMTGPNLALIDDNLAKLRRLLVAIDLSKSRHKAISSITWNTLEDQIKNVIQDRAKQLRETVYKIIHIEYKPINQKFYGGDFLDKASYVFDKLTEFAADVWNYFADTVIGVYTGIKEYLPRALWILEGLAGVAFSLLIGFIDLILTLVRKVLEAILYFVNCPTFASSKLSYEARNLGEYYENMPATLDPEFYNFSAKMVEDVARALDPGEIANLPGGKESRSAALKTKFQGAYEMYYTPQWARARDYFIEIAGPKGALNVEWLKSGKVRGNNHEVTTMLKGIIQPLTAYQNSFATREEGLGSFWKFWYQGGEWTAEDTDQCIELAGTATGWTLRIGSIVLILYPPAIPHIPKIMKAADCVDLGAAATRALACVFWTMPNVLGMQFDIMRMTNLAYRAVFMQRDVSQALLDKPEPAHRPGSPK